MDDDLRTEEDIILSIIDGDQGTDDLGHECDFFWDEHGRPRRRCYLYHHYGSFYIGMPVIAWGVTPAQVDAVAVFDEDLAYWARSSIADRSRA